MGLAAIDSATMLALMVAGAVFALAGLWLMFRPKHDGSSAKIELLGMKFESSSAGLLVFLIGAAFLAVPLFVGKAPGAETKASATSDAATAQQSSSEDAKGNQRSEQASVALSDPGNASVSEPAGQLLLLEGEEIEPNDTPSSANVIALGSAVTGTIAAGARDFFYVQVPPDEYSELAINATSTDFILRVYDDLGAEIWSHKAYDTQSSAYRGKVEYAAYYCSLETWDDDREFDYQVSVAARPE